MAKTLKHSYTVPCARRFRDAVMALAERRGVNAADLARSVLLVVPAETVEAWPDPGDPPPEDRETVTLKSGPSAGRPWRRKPRLQVRMAPGYAVTTVRKALGMALAMDGDGIAVHVGQPAEEKEAQPEPETEDAVARAAAQAAQEAKRSALAAHEAEARAAREEVERLRTVVSVLAFEPLAEGVQSRADALYVLGFPPHSNPDYALIRARFRMLATIHHPDSPYGDHRRMSQVNAAFDLLRRAAA